MTAGPALFNAMLRAGLPADALAGVRLAALYQRWTSRFGVDILDGIGMTEMLHIFLSNRPGQVRAGTTGVAVPESALIEFCRAGLPSFKRPRRIMFVTEYPATSTGKIRRVELRAQAAAIMQETAW